MSLSMSVIPLLFLPSVSAAVPVIAAVMASLTAGITIDVVKFQKKLNKKNIAKIPTVFTSREMLIEAIYAYDTEHACTVYQAEDGSVTARFMLEDYEFTMNKNGMYDLTVRNAGSCEEILEQINMIQQEYVRAVRTEVYNRLINSAESNQWSIESEEIEEDGTLRISLTV